MIKLSTFCTALFTGILVSNQALAITSKQTAISTHSVTDIKTSGRTILYLDNNVLTISDAALTTRATLPIPGCSYNSSTNGIHLDTARRIAFVSNGKCGVTIVDYADVRYPRILSSYTNIDSESFVFSSRLLNPNILLLAAGEGGVIVLDISHLSDPVKLSQIDTPGFAQGLDVKENFVFIADDISGFYVAELSSTTYPRMIGYLPIPANDVKISPLNPNLAVLANYSSTTNPSRIVTVDISDPKNPRQWGYREDSGQPQSVEIIGDRAYIADGLLGVAVYDISAPQDPRLMKLYTFTSGFFMNTGYFESTSVREPKGIYAAGVDGGVKFISW